MPRNNFILALHSTNDNFGFAYKRINAVQDKPKIFTKKFEKNLTNNIIYDLREFLPTRSFKEIQRISISLGPANFNATRQIVVLARTLSQQINCSIDSYSSFNLMAKRIAIKNNIFANKKSFWIFKELKRKGYIAGQYEIYISKKINQNITIKEKIIPKVFKELTNFNCFYNAEYDVLEDLKELLNLSEKNKQNANLNTWDKVLPLYPISPIN